MSWKENMKKVLIICTGNSCRSIMAEALINHHLSGQWQAFSAGTHPSYVNPRAVQVLQEMGVDTDYLRSKSISEFWHWDDLDMIITVCDHAKENCPVFYKPVPRIHIGFSDPADYNQAPDEEALPKFRAVRDEILERLIPYLQDHA